MQLECNRANSRTQTSLSGYMSQSLQWKWPDLKGDLYLSITESVSTWSFCIPFFPPPSLDTLWNPISDSNVGKVGVQIKIHLGILWTTSRWSCWFHPPNRLPSPPLLSLPTNLFLYLETSCLSCKYKSYPWFLAICNNFLHPAHDKTLPIITSKLCLDSVHFSPSSAPPPLS